jgi:outer membrane protein OmpA-like peptidoglycan-associated protein
MGGLNDGFQIQASISNTVGYVWGGKITQRAPVPPPGPTKITVIPVSKDKAVIHLHGDVLFDFDKWDFRPRSHVKPQAEDLLNEVAAYIKATPPNSVSVEGHTDGIGPAKYNIGLSNRRAQTVANWLTTRKVFTGTIAIQSFGMLKPFAPNFKPDGSDDPVGRAKNRRVEIWLGK